MADNSSQPNPPEPVSGGSKDVHKPVRWISLLAGIGTGLGIALSIYGWVESQADIRLDVNSVRLVRANPPLKSLNSLPEYEVLKYNFMPEDELAKLHAEWTAQLPTERGPGRPRDGGPPRHWSSAPAEARTLLDDSQRSRWIEETSAHVKDTRETTESQKKALSHLAKNLEDLKQSITAETSAQIDDGSALGRLGPYIRHKIKGEHNNKEKETAEKETAEKETAEKLEKATEKLERATEKLEKAAEKLEKAAGKKKAAENDPDTQKQKAWSREPKMRPIRPGKFQQPTATRCLRAKI